MPHRARPGPGFVRRTRLLENVPLDRVFGGGLQDMPAIPVAAAAIGMAGAVGIGAPAGLVPASVPVKVTVIDAIRY